MEGGNRSLTWAVLASLVVSATLQRDSSVQKATASMPPATIEGKAETERPVEMTPMDRTTLILPNVVSKTTLTSAPSSSLCLITHYYNSVLIEEVGTWISGGQTYTDESQPLPWRSLVVLVSGVVTEIEEVITADPSECEERSFAVTVGVQEPATGFEVEFQPSTTISVDSSGTPFSVPDGWQPLSTPMVTPAPATRFFSADLQTAIAVDQTTLVAGGQTATFGDTSPQTFLHVDRSGQIIVVADGSTSPFVPPVLIGGKEATPLPSGFVMEQQTLSQGGPPITLGSGPTATTFFINSAGQTMAIGPNSSIAVETPTVRPLVVGDTTASILASEYQYVVDSQTLKMSHPITVDGVAVSLTADADGTTVLVAGIHSFTLAGASTAALNVVTRVVSGTTGYILGSATLSVGHPITVVGTPVYIATVSGQTLLVVGTKTTTLGDAGPTDVREERSGTGAAASVSIWTVIWMGALALTGFA